MLTILMGIGALISLLIVIYLLVAFAVINFTIPTRDPNADWYSKRMEKELRKLERK